MRSQIVYNPEAEDTVIGTILFEGDLFETVVEEGIKETHFFDRVNQRIFDAALKLWTSKGSVLTYDLLLEELKKERVIPDLIDEARLLERYAGKFVRSREVLAEYCKVVKKYALKRELVELAEEILSKDYKDPEELLNQLLDRAFELSSKREVVPYVSLADVVPELKETIERFAKSTSYITGIPSGFPDLDRLTTGFHGGELIIVAGRPGMGKSSFALSIAKHVAQKEGLPVGIFSLEMSKEQLALRLLSFLSLIPLHNLRLGKLTEDEKLVLEEALKQLAELPIYIDDSAALTTTELRIKALRMKKERGIELLIVDYLQLLRGVKKYSSRQEEVAEISRSLKALAKELDIPIIALAQLSRQVEHRSDKRPQLADLRESGQIEQDADLIIFLHRPEYYLKIKKKEVPPDLVGKVEIIVAKQRQGPQGIVEANFIEKLSLFEPKDPTDELGRVGEETAVEPDLDLLEDADLDLDF
ncbi:MAG: replicative DNA helicase [Aquificae bacterium]|nr:replicative DNA helicase [Aquificota bacterium]